MNLNLRDKFSEKLISMKGEDIIVVLRLNIIIAEIRLGEKRLRHVNKHIKEWLQD
jgi:hypothetical protein